MSPQEKLTEHAAVKMNVKVPLWWDTEPFDICSEVVQLCHTVFFSFCPYLV